MCGVLVRLADMDGSALYEGSGLNSTIGVSVVPIEEKIGKAALLLTILLVGVVLNLVVFVCTVSHPKSLKQSAIMFLLGSSVVNFMILLSYIPAQVITTFTEEWVFGRSEEERKAWCQINSFFTGSGETTNHILALISVDRFFVLVKPLIHKQYFKPWLSTLMLFIVFVIVTTQAAVDLALDRAEFGTAINICLPTREVGIVINIFSAIIAFMPIIAITITTVWTFVSTRRFIKSHHQQRIDAVGSKQEEAKEIENNLYTRQIRNLFGIFSALVIAQIISVLPHGVIIIISASIGAENLLREYVFVTTIFIYLGCISNPIIQCYFRKDLSDGFKAAFVKVKSFCCKTSH